MENPRKRGIRVLMTKRKSHKKLGLAMGLGKLEGIDNEVSCCYECDQLTNDSFETYWNEKGEPFCEACFLDDFEE